MKEIFKHKVLRSKYEKQMRNQREWIGALMLAAFIAGGAFGGWLMKHKDSDVEIGMRISGGWTPLIGRWGDHKDAPLNRIVCPLGCSVVRDGGQLMFIPTPEINCPQPAPQDKHFRGL